MQAFLEPLKELADYQEIVSSRRKKTGFLQIAGCVNSQKIHLAKALSDGFEYRVIVFPVKKKQNRLMKNGVYWRKMYGFIRQEIFCFIMQILRVHF